MSLSTPELLQPALQKGSVALHTLGCKLNFSETSFIGKQFRERGFTTVPFDSAADVYVINTCTVTENAEKECRQIVRRALRLNPEAYVIVTGCYAQLRPEEITSIEGVDAVLGSKEKFKLFSYIDDFSKRSFACTFVSPRENLSDEFGFASSAADDRTRAYFKVQDGCDYKCTFCTIPQARGKSRSLNASEAVAGFTSLLRSGYKEIILTGVNVGDYQTEDGTTLAGLIRQFLAIDEDFRIRISSIEPNLLSDEIIDLTVKDKRMCRHFHIPLQSGSSDILKQMKRRYGTELYAELIEKLNTALPGLGIGVDVITGFPGETDELFDETRRFLADLNVSYLHCFTYSQRPNTPAEQMSVQIDAHTKRNRTNILRALSERKRRSFYDSLIGSTAEVLFEDGEIEGMMRGFSSNYARISAPYQPEYVNRLIPVTITGADENICKGEIL